MAWKLRPSARRGWLALIGLACALAGVAWAADKPVRPHPDLDPTQVIAAQLAALRDNGEDDAGIAVAFRFASPGNREQTGPLPRFAKMIKTGFADMLMHKRHEFAPLLVEGDRAAQLVTLVQADGSRRAYFFHLARVAGEAACEAGCWFVDGVQPVPVGAEPDAGGITI